MKQRETKTKREKSELTVMRPSATFQMRAINEKTEKTDSTKENCLYTIKSFEHFLTGSNLKNVWDSINTDTFNEYVKYLESNNKSHSTIKSYIKNLTALCGKASKDKSIDFKKEAIEDFELKKYRTTKTLIKAKRPPLTEEEVQRIYAYKSDNDRENEVRDIFVLQCELGQRISDMDKFVKGG
ncbi:MAG: site-specific integrase, partial [Tannerella sp.]|nr:site-specific integrase [Tannerella sp.]